MPDYGNQKRGGSISALPMEIIAPKKSNVLPVKSDWRPIGVPALAQY
jgi:hypothetical protein